MKESKTCLQKAFEEMSTAQLDEQLQQELQKEEPEAEVVLGIMRVLQDREADYPIVITREVCEAWEKYKEKTAPSKKKSRKRAWVVSVAAVAAVVCIVLMAIPRMVGAESVFDVLFRWTESVFEFFTPEQDATNPPVDYVFETDNLGLQQLYDEVTALGATDQIVPMWVPDGYELSELKVTPIPNGNKVHAKLEKDSRVMLVTYWIGSGMHVQHEKEDLGIETYECSDISHFIMDNGENFSVTWEAKDAACSLSADLEKEDLYKVIDSIYKKGL